MIKFFCLFFIALATGFFAQTTQNELDIIRNNYDKALFDKKLCSQMMEKLQLHENQNVHLAYLGGYQSIWANHVFSPIAKLKTFKNGKQNIKKALSQDPDNVEIRFIRLSIQKNAPFFLDYHENIKEDEAFLKQHKNKINSSVLLNMINQLLKQ